MKKRLMLLLVLVLAALHVDAEETHIQQNDDDNNPQYGKETALDYEGSGYIGCFQDDSSSRTVDGPLITDNSMTIEQCRDKCYQLNKNIAGLENGNACYCGNTYKQTIRLKDSQCNRRCPGNKKQTCGGHGAISVYKAKSGKHNIDNKLKRNKRSVRRRRKRGKKIRRKNRKRRGKSGAKNRKSGRKGNIRKKTWKCYRYSAADKKQIKKKGQKAVCQRFGGKFTRGKNARYPGCRTCWCCQRKEKKRTCKNVKCKKNFVCVKGKCKRRKTKRTCKNVMCKKNFVCVKGECKRKARSIKKIVCEHKSATLKCPGKKTIKILEATYGRTDRTTCKHHAMKTTSCSSTKPLPIIRKKCDGVNSCGVTSSNWWYGDPCRGTYKYLVVRYICEARGIKKIVCEYKSATLKCPGKKTIKILEATYGRTDRTTCKHHAIKTTSCSSTKPLPIIRKKCDGVNSCGVTSSNGLYGNPCRGTYKYLVVRYICEGRSISNIVCEGKSATLKCPGRKIIKILAATYGRTDMTTCKHHSIKTTSCSSDKPLPIIMKKCDGVNSCGVTSSNGLYGDPCRGTYKYLVVRYICKAKKRTCKNVKCKKNFVCVKGKCQRKGTTTCKRKCKKNAECKNGKCQCKKGFYKSRRGSCKNKWKCYHYSAADNKQIKKKGQKAVCQRFGRIFTRGKNYKYPGCKTCWCCQKKGTSKCKKPCHSNAKCRKGRCICKKGYSGDGVNKCSKSCTCSATGDPHYRLFDGQMIHFMGTCKYLLSKYDKQKSTCRYEVQVRNENRGKNKRVSFTKSVHVIVRGTKIDLLKKKKLQINGVKTYLPYKSADFSITNTGRYIKLVTLCKVVITWDGRSAVTVIAPQHLSPSLSGLCGNCNGIRDDFRLSGGLDVRMKPDKFKLIGESYLIPEGNDKKCGIETPPDPCTPALRKKAEGNSACGRISLVNPNNPFKKCASKDKAMVEDMYETCIYDYCAYSDVPDMLATVVCEAAEGLEERCGNMGLDINWRTKSFCPIACGENMEYSSAISGCPATCVDEDAPKFCIMAISEGCQCKKGFVLSDDKCIPKEQCGCRGPAGEYYPISTEVTSRDCTSITRCIVTKSGKAKLKLVQRQKCHRNGKCILQDGIFQCVCEDGYKGDGISKCKGPKGPDIENIICEGKSATLKCPGRKTIKILDATYGRTDMTTCKHPSIKTTSCSSYKPLPIIRKKCDGVNSCSVTSSNGLYGDPCRGTYKYLVVRYICEGNQPKCGSSVCHSDAKCQRRHCVCKKGFTGDGVNSCIGTCTCSATGDPHYKTFDGQVIHFMGICTYTMVKSTGVDKCGGFRVEVKNEHRGNKRVSFTRYVDVILKDTIIHLGRKNQILVNNVEVFTPYSCINFEITASGKYVRLQTKCGMVATWNGRGAVSVSLPKTYSGKVSGLCGDCNGKRDDFRTATGEDVRSKKNKFVLIGNSYIVKEKSDMTKAKCIVSKIDDEPCSSKDKLEKASKDRNCGMMNPENTKSPFKSCFSKNMAMSKELYDTCLYDYCSNMDQPNLLTDVVCESMEGYEEQCENMGLSITWRGKYFCPMQCDANMEYSSSVSGCPATCVNPDAAASCRLPNSEGCQCKRGFLLSGTECVPKSKCGCRGPQGEYYPLGKTVTSADCSVITKCSIENGKATMIKVKSQNCHKNARCRLRRGEYKCVCRRKYKGNGVGSCKAVCKPKCRKNAVCIKGKCKCRRGYYRSKLLGICKRKKKPCKPKCRKNSVCVKGKCKCRRGYYRSKLLGICKRKKKPCKPKCRKNSVCVKGKCKCRRGYYRSKLLGICKRSTSKCKKPCHSNAKCRKGRCICIKGYSGDGVNKCSKSCTCSATGDPHYRLFDGQMIHFMGTCKYLLSKYDKQKSTCRYEVQVRNENRGKNKRVSFTKSVHVIVRGTKIDLLKKKKLQINGVKTFLPYKSADFSITNTGRYIKLVTLCKVVITWDGRSAVTVIAPQHLSPSLSGLCGNCNGIRDDFRLSGGLDVRMKPDKFKLIGESYLIPEGNDKKCGIETPPDPCTPVLRKKAEGNSACGRISLDNPNNPFKKCASKDKAMVEDMYETCIYDYCAYSDVPDMLDTVVCEAAEGLEERCGNMGLDINWRTKSFCPIACGENMEYNSAISGCPATCVDEDAPKFCIMAISEGCQCKKGFVLSDDKCIPKEQCGCRGPAGEYYPISTEITSRDCTSITRCIVTKSGKAKLKLVQRQKCHRNGKCILQDGIFQCVCEDGYKGDGISKCKGPKGPDIENIICEGKSATLKCPGRKTIKILEATYGRTDMTTCKHPSIKTTSCSSYKPLPIIRKKCDGVNSCSVTSSNGLYGDPCRGTYKYLVVRYICEGNQPKCGSSVCHSDAKCQRRHCVCKKGFTGDGVNSCIGTCTCSATGDPHYKTFDGQVIHFMGICTYTMVKSTGVDKCGGFRVEVKNEHRGNKRVSFTRYVDVILKDTIIHLGRKNQILVNNVEVFTPYSCINFEITASGKYVRLQTKCGMVVTWNGRGAVSVSLPKTYSGKVSGLCGDCNGKRDDFRTATGEDVRSKKNKFVLIGNSYIVKEKSDMTKAKCIVSTIDDEPCSSKDKLEKASKDRNCGMMNPENTKSPFKSCFSKNMAMSKELYDTCLYDYCSNMDQPNLLPDIVCESMEGYEEQCENMGLSITWRGTYFCPMQCDANMEYSSSVSGCPATCVNPDAAASCRLPNSEGCQCKRGFLLSGTECVPKSKCGCRGPQGEYYPLGKTVTSADCSVITKCSIENGKATMIKVKSQNCHKNARCRLRRGKYKCVCRRKYKGNGVGSCKAVCKPKCRKNAVCIKGKCKCRRGYYRSKLLGICKRKKKPCKPKCRNNSVCVKGKCKYALECLTETMGLDYVGSISTTVTGRTCQHWKKQSPHTHIYYNVGDGHNYCRNPDRESKPWCYTTDKDKRWEYCDIPLCIGPKPPCSTSLEMTCSSKSQKKTECTVADADKVNYVELVGSVNNAACVFGVTYGYYGKTIWSTKICQNKFKVCITPDIPDPEPPSSEGCRTTERGQEYKGSASVTENGLTCQYWKFQYPHKHSFEHLKTEHNYCRNPDNSARPWCYTNDPSKRWKYCHIPMCAVCTIQEDIDKCKASIQMSGKCLYKSKQGSKCNYSVELQGSEATVKIGTTEISLTNGRTLSECAQFTYDQGTLLIEEDVCKCKKDNM